ncbi:NPCBM/NEW2 domain-containing protein [Anaerocellum danielii]|uniref:NPCBM/NEW2 domain-containing protein n=1 Tax=Anaerocellum danielii TaxID=1387557 RepID=A0ABZ0U190_9FIRM|nr:NPCBM/NEW2 domain-containing protein [Caldicellulosiruptor danielii]WPX09492.1 NPCBM/NEW2 domain-containing protein [Caldicellulosiruptor danielii]
MPSFFCFVAVVSSPKDYKTMYEKLLKDYNSLKTQYEKLKKDNATLQAKVNELSKKATANPVYEYQRDIILNGVTLKYKVPFINYKGMRYVHLDSILYCFYNKNISPWKIVDNKKALVIGPDLTPDGGIYLTDLPLSDYYSIEYTPVSNSNEVTILGQPKTKNIVWRAYNKDYWNENDPVRYTFVQYKLNGDYKKLKLTLGLDDDTDVGASGVFRIYLDGEKKYETPIAKGEKAKNATIEVAGGNTLKIEFYINHHDRYMQAFPVVADAVLYK